MPIPNLILKTLASLAVRLPKTPPVASIKFDELKFEDQNTGIVISNAYKFSGNIKKPYFKNIKPESGYVFNKLLNNYLFLFDYKYLQL